MNVEPPETFVIIESIVYKSNGFAIGGGTKKAPVLTIRLVQIRSKISWRSYLTSVREPEILPPYVVADLYQRRWRIEEAFCLSCSTSKLH